jgi:hypothetical protein
MDVEEAQCFVLGVAIEAREVFLANCTSATTELLLNLLTVGCFQWTEAPTSQGCSL